MMKCAVNITSDILSKQSCLYNNDLSTVNCTRGKPKTSTNIIEN